MTHTPVRIAICDDTALMRELVRVVFADVPEAQIVGEADDGPAGIELVEAQRPDVLICDMQMPTLNGLDVLAVVRERMPHVRVVMFSSDPWVEQAALQGGAAAFLVKGEDPDLLVAAVMDREFREAA